MESRLGGEGEALDVIRMWVVGHKRPMDVPRRALGCRELTAPRTESMACRGLQVRGGCGTLRSAGAFPLLCRRHAASTNLCLEIFVDPLERPFKNDAARTLDQLPC